MSHGSVLPTCQAVAQLLTMLIGRPVKVTKTKLLSSAKQPVVANYIEASGATLAAALADLDFAVHSASALAMLPPGAASEELRTGVLSQLSLENYHEVINVACAALNEVGLKHVKLDQIALAPPMPPGIAALLRPGHVRLDMEAKVEGYGSGKLSLIRLPS